jgi:hypothetical protein
MQTIVNVKKASPPYIAASRFAPLIAKSMPGLVGYPPIYIGNKDNIPLLRNFLWDEIQKGNPEVIEPLLQVADDWVIGCWCVDMQGQEIYTSKDVCMAQVIFKAAKFLRNNLHFAEVVTTGNKKTNRGKVIDSVPMIR